MKNLQIVGSPSEFFLETVKSSAQSKNIILSAESEFYLVSLLSRLSRSDELFSIGKNGANKREPLVFLLKEAEDEVIPANKKVIYQHIGDISLHTVGIFPERAVSDSYYCTLGKLAYSETARLHNLKSMKHLYRDLSWNFEKFVAVLKGIAIY